MAKGLAIKKNRYVTECWILLYGPQTTTDRSKMLKHELMITIIFHFLIISLQLRTQTRTSGRYILWLQYLMVSSFSSCYLMSSTVLVLSSEKLGSCVVTNVGMDHQDPLNKPMHSFNTNNILNLVYFAIIYAVKIVIHVKYYLHILSYVFL